MRNKAYIRTLLVMTAVCLIAAAAVAQRRPARTPAKSAAKPVIFAVLNDGKMLEPIAYIENGKLADAIDGSDDAAAIKAFSDKYYTARSTYTLIFGGANAGTVAVAKPGVIGECSPNMAEASVTSTRANLRGRVMALATNAPVGKAVSGVRRMPTWPERNEIDELVRAEFARNQVEVKKLDYHNLTALDVNNDKRADLVGSFWAENDPKSRTLLFFIAEKGTGGKYEIRFSDLRTIKEDEVMSGDITSLDQGIYHELLLDAFDYDNDGVSEIFTYFQSFEGAGFYVYKRGPQGWTRAYEGSNYHCGY